MRKCKKYCYNINYGPKIGFIFFTKNAIIFFSLDFLGEVLHFVRFTLSSNFNLRSKCYNLGSVWSMKLNKKYDVEIFLTGYLIIFHIC